MKGLDISNPEHIGYEHGGLAITVLGGIRLEGLDRMRVTLKIQVEHLSLRHSLDLYNDNQLEKLVRKVAEKLEIGTSVTTAALNELTDLLEQYRLSEIERQNLKEDKRVVLNSKEIEQAQAYLSAPNLMERTKEDIGRAGVIGEENHRLLMYLIFTSRKREHPLHIVSLGSSGIGKTHLQEKVGALIPEEDRIEITTLSENAFYYFGKRQLQNKLILIEDLDGAEDVLYPLRELQSKKRISKTVVHKNTKGETRTVHLTVEGPVSVAGCTTKESLYEDNANRSFLIYIDESKEQDERVMQYQRMLSAGKVDTAEQRKIVQQFQDMQRVLQNVQVRNPYAELLAIPNEVLKPRRTNAHYLAFIELVTFYHQYQREKKHDAQTGEEYIETTPQDIAEANKLLKEILLRKSDQLTGACRDYFERLKGWLQKENHKTFSNREARQALRINASNQKRYMLELTANYMIRVANGKKARGYEYQVVSYEEYKLLKSGIETVLDEILVKVERSTGSPVVHKPNEPLKAKRASKLGGVVRTE